MRRLRSWIYRPATKTFPEANLAREGRDVRCHVFLSRELAIPPTGGVELRAPCPGLVPVTIVENCSTQVSLLGTARIQLLAVSGYSRPFRFC